MLDDLPNISCNMNTVLQGSTLDLTNSFQRKNNLYIYGAPPDGSNASNTDVKGYLRSVLENAVGLSSFSEELDIHIHDCYTEYHLSSKRANLPRGFDFSRVNSILKVGYKCGSITRFLAGQGIWVDAVEGDAVSAELAALRCRGLDWMRGIPRA